MYDPFNIVDEDNVWPPGLYGTDASGGKWGAYPNLRRCGCGVASMTGLDAPYTIQFAARCQLPGEWQSVPRAELYAIYMLVSHVRFGVLRVVSDSDVNIGMYYRGKLAAIASVNGDLWKLIFQHLEQYAIQLKLFWVPGHLDTAVPKSKKHVPDIFFAVNHVADRFASIAANAVQLDMNVVAKVLYYTSLVKKIQKRLVRVLVSLVEKAKYDKKFPTLVEPKPTLNHFIQNTSHNLSISDGCYKCLDCHASVGRSSPNLVNWMKSQCIAVPYDDSLSPARVPGWFRIQIGNTIPHVSHELLSIRGVLFCNMCGAYGAKKCVLLAKPCALHCTTSSKLARDRLLLSKLPGSLRRWPRLDCVVLQPALTTISNINDNGPLDNSINRNPDLRDGGVSMIAEHGLDEPSAGRQGSSPPSGSNHSVGPSSSEHDLQGCVPYCGQALLVGASGKRAAPPHPPALPSGAVGVLGFASESLGAEPPGVSMLPDTGQVSDHNGASALCGAEPPEASMDTNTDNSVHVACDDGGSDGHPLFFNRSYRLGSPRRVFEGNMSGGEPCHPPPLSQFDDPEFESHHDEDLF